MQLISWITLSLLSAVFLGLYDIAKKSAVHKNAVPAVLQLNVATAAAIWALPVLAAFLVPESSNPWLGQLADLAPRQHFLLLFKSALVGTSWMLAFFALKHLPISIATPIRATSPVWVLLAAVTWMGERPSETQWVGIAIVIVSFVAFSRVGAKEGIRFYRNRWIWWMAGATLLGAASAIYDKHLLQVESLAPHVVQAWFSIYLVLVMLPLSTYWFCWERRTSPFQWRWSIPMIAILLLAADYLYFTAITHEDALIAVISTLRRASVIVSFGFGILRLNEMNWRAKAPCVLATLLGVYLIGR